MNKEEIYDNIRNTFHNQSGLFLNKEQSMAIATIIYQFNKSGEYLGPLDKLAGKAIMWQNMFNKAQEELETLDGDKRMKVKVKTKKELVERALGYYDDDEEYEED
jgi:hypothetical protein